MGLNSNKNLKNYDCWDEEKKPVEWVDKYKELEGAHAQCPIYKNK